MTKPKQLSRKTKTVKQPNLLETKTHITKAGHEIMLAAEGLYFFCKSYVEAQSLRKPYRDWIRNFSKLVTTVSKTRAYTTATTIGSNVLRNVPLKNTVQKLSGLGNY